MKFDELQKFALSLPDVTQQPHHRMSSFRVRGKIFVTVPPDQEHIHLFVAEPERETALVLYAGFTEKLLWGGKVAGLRLGLEAAPSAVVQHLVRQAWRHKAPESLSDAL